MLYILFSAMIIIPTLLGWGKFSEYFLGKIWNGISGKLVSGIMFLIIIWTLISFFSGLNIFIELAFILIGIFFFFKFKNFNEVTHFFKKASILFYIIVFLILFFGSYHRVILDHFGYYVPTIKWLSEFGLVKGISNLDLLLGQMSFWHVFQSGFSNFADPFLKINCILLFVYLIYVFEKKSWIPLVFFPFFIVFAKSPNTDLPVIIFSLMIVQEILNKNTKTHLLFALSMIVFAIKPTMIWVPIFVFLYGIFFQKLSVQFLIPGVFILLIFLFKNIWCFGFPIFPVQIGDLELSWKPNKELLKISSEVAISKTYDLQYSYAEIKNFTASEYVKNWLFLKGIKGKIHLLFLFSWIVFIIYSIKRKNKLIYLLAFSLFIKTLLVLLFSAQYRFFLDIFFMMFFMMFYEFFDKKKSILTFSFLTLITFFVVNFPKVLQDNIPSFKLGKMMQGFEKEQFYKPSVYQLNQYRIYQIGNLKFNVVKDYPFSFDTPIPAISPEFLFQYDDAGIFPQLNSEEIKDGFHWKKLNAKEKIQLKKILEENKIERMK